MGQLDLTKNEAKPDQAYWEKRNRSIERQVAAKCTAQELTGQSAMPVKRHEIFQNYLDLIRGQ